MFLLNFAHIYRYGFLRLGGVLQCFLNWPIQTSFVIRKSIKLANCYFYLIKLHHASIISREQDQSRGMFSHKTRHNCCGTNT